MSVPVRRLGGLLREYNIPAHFSLLSIDIEGEDISVLNDLIVHDDYRPLSIIIEASYGFATRALTDLPFAPDVLAAYDLVGQTEANLILEIKAGAV